MRVAIIGGGPGGLYLALLLRRRRPDWPVRVLEQAPAGAAPGWGVVLSGRALGFLRDADPASHADLAAELTTWDDQVIVHRGVRVVVDGIGFSGIARRRLLQLLQAHCLRAGVELHFERPVRDVEGLRREHDLVVGADGVRSAVREAYAETFQPEWRLLTNRYVWLGTAQPFDALTLTFREHAGGAFVAHHYPYAPDRSAFIVECDAGTWERAGLGQMAEPAWQAHAEAVFRADLGGHPLLTQGARWLRFAAVRCGRWQHANVTLIGDALRTVHFSVGSGTRTALEDAIALAAALVETGEAAAGLAAFEAARRPAAEALLEVAARSFDWYERFPEHLALDPLPFAHAYVTRGGRITPEALHTRSPRFSAAWTAWVDRARRGGESA